MLSLGWFSTGSGEGSLGLLNEIYGAIESGTLDATVDFVFCNRDKGESIGSDEFLSTVSSYDIPLVTLSSEKFRKNNGGGTFSKHRIAFDNEVIDSLSVFHPDICVLAGYMLIVGPILCKKYSMLNLHPALPGGPTGTWRDVIWALIKNNASESGAYVHLVTEDLDQGPLLTYSSFPIKEDVSQDLWDDVEGLSVDHLKATLGEDLPLFQYIRKEGLLREKPLLLETIKAFTNGSLNANSLDLLKSMGISKCICLNDSINESISPKQRDIT